MNTKEKIEVMQAYLDGKTVQWRWKQGQVQDWTDSLRAANSDLMWNWDNYEYRIKSKPLTYYGVFFTRTSDYNRRAYGGSFRDKATAENWIVTNSWQNAVIIEITDPVI